MEPLIDPTFDKPPVVIPHHKGRKRFHLEIKDAMFRMGTDFKQTMVDTIKNTWKTVYQLASFGRTEDNSKANLEQEIDRVIEDELSSSDENQDSGIDIPIGQLNGGRRIDYVLQEGPLESFNEYLFALSSHVCYWESEDTMLLIMKEIYQSIGVLPDKQNITLSSPNQPLGSASVQPPGISMQGSLPAQFNNYNIYQPALSSDSYRGTDPVTMYSSANTVTVTAQSYSMSYTPMVPTSSYYVNNMVPPNPSHEIGALPSSMPPFIDPDHKPNSANPFSSSSNIAPTSSYYTPGSNIPQSNIQLQRASPAPGISQANVASMSGPVGPPPLSGFVRKS
jgi:hypothetical protein